MYVKAKISVSSHNYIFRYQSSVQPKSFSKQVQSHPTKRAHNKIQDFCFILPSIYLHIVNEVAGKFSIQFCQICQFHWLMCNGVVAVQRECSVHDAVGRWRGIKIHTVLLERSSVQIITIKHDTMLFQDVALLQFSQK